MLELTVSVFFFVVTRSNYTQVCLVLLRLA